MSYREPAHDRALEEAREAFRPRRGHTMSEPRFKVGDVVAKYTATGGYVNIGLRGI